MAKRYYGGVLLKELPEREEYPYQLIYTYDSDGKTFYSVCYTKSQLYAVENSLAGYFALTQPESTEYITMFCSSDTINLDWLGETVEEANTNVAYIGTVGYSEYTLLWTNADIKKDSSDSTEVYFAATESILYVPEIVSPTYYNGVLLPEIPVDSSKPYSYIVKTSSTDDSEITYILITADVLGYIDVYQDPLLGIYVSADGTYSMYSYTQGDDAEWSYVGESTITANQATVPIGTAGTMTYELIWANVDVPKGVDSTEIYLEATDPVPETTEDQEYVIMGSTLTDFADQARRLGNTTETLTPAEMITIFQGVESVDSLMMVEEGMF